MRGGDSQLEYYHVEMPFLGMDMTQAVDYGLSDRKGGRGLACVKCRVVDNMEG